MFLCVLVRVCVCRCVASACACVWAWVQACACMRGALLIQHATRHHIAICALCGSTIRLDIYLTNDTIFGKTLLDIKSVF